VIFRFLTSILLWAVLSCHCNKSQLGTNGVLRGFEFLGTTPFSKAENNEMIYLNSKVFVTNIDSFVIHSFSSETTIKHLPDSLELPNIMTSSMFLLSKKGSSQGFYFDTTKASIKIVGNIDSMLAKNFPYGDNFYNVLTTNRIDSILSVPSNKNDSIVSIYVCDTAKRSGKAKVTIGFSHGSNYPGFPSPLKEIDTVPNRFLSLLRIDFEISGISNTDQTEKFFLSTKKRELTKLELEEQLRMLYKLKEIMKMNDYKF
jgi:hypothetical protein